MTEEQREAIRILNRINQKILNSEHIINDAEYFLLLSFIVNNKNCNHTCQEPLPWWWQQVTYTQTKEQV